MTWTCWLCGRELRVSLTDRATCECGQAFVLAMVPESLTHMDPTERPIPHVKGNRCSTCRRVAARRAAIA